MLLLPGQKLSSVTVRFFSNKSMCISHNLHISEHNVRTSFRNLHYKKYLDLESVD